MSILGTDVDFRGTKRDVELEYEGDGIIVWWFTDEGVCAGKDTTQAEQDAVYQQLWAYLEDRWASQCDYDDR